MTMTHTKRQAGSMTLQQVADTLEVSAVHETHDFGSAIMYRLTHPLMGLIVLVNTCADLSGYMPI